MKIIDVYPLKAQFKKFEEIFIEVLLDLNVDDKNKVYLQYDIFNLEKRILNNKIELNEEKPSAIIKFKIPQFNEDMKGYSINVSLFKNGSLIDSKNTAFDVVTSCTLTPRYGFLSDFKEEDSIDNSDILSMNKFHINIVQFYDWMFRHHDLIPKQINFIDPLGRKLSIKTVKNKIDNVHKVGMMALAYGAVYGAEEEFYKEHTEWVLCKNDGKIYNFINLIYMMDISRDNGWHDHIISEFYKSIDFGFDGIHMDQYGFPKEAVVFKDGRRKVRYLRDDFLYLINDTKQFISKNGKESILIFNAVNNWPIESACKSYADVNYIEVWPPYETYYDLYYLITNAKKLSPQKQVVLAAYMKPFADEHHVFEEEAHNATILTMAAIFASGGFHLLLGEENGLLMEAYYPNYKRITSVDFINELRNYYDFIVRYEELLFDLSIKDITYSHTGGINSEYIFNGSQFSIQPNSNSVWTVIKEKPNYKIINLVNYNGIDNMNWNESKKQRPNEVNGIEVLCYIAEKVKNVYLISLDFSKGDPVKLDFSYVDKDDNKYIKFIVPKLLIWDVIYIECI